MWKAIVSGTAGTARPDCRRPQAIDLCIPEETISNQGDIWATVLQGETPATQDTDKENRPGHRTQDTYKENHWSADERMLGKLPDCRFYLISLFSEFQIPCLHIFFPLVKRLA